MTYFLFISIVTAKLLSIQKYSMSMFSPKEILHRNWVIKKWRNSMKKHNSKLNEIKKGVRSLLGTGTKR